MNTWLDLQTHVKKMISIYYYTPLSSPGFDITKGVAFLVCIIVLVRHSMTFNKCFFNDSRPIYNDNKWYEKETLQKGKDDAGDFLWLAAAVADHNLDPLFSGVFAANNLKPTRQTTLDLFF